VLGVFGCVWFGGESDGSKKRKKSDDDFDDRLEEDDYDLIEENLGVKVERRVGFIIFYAVKLL
jgi:hypothetical protein